MKTALNIVAGLGIVCAWCASATAQTTPSSDASAGEIVVLDVARVFKENTVFNQKIEAIQGQAQKLKAEVEASQQQLQAEAKEVNEKFATPSADRKQAEADLEQKMTSLRTYARQSEADLMAQEAKIYHDTYVQMQQIVARAAQANNIAMVLRFDSSTIDPNSRPDVIKGVNRAIVFQQDRDITDYVIGEMNKLQSAATGGNPSR